MIYFTDIIFWQHLTEVMAWTLLHMRLIISLIILWELFDSQEQWIYLKPMFHQEAKSLKYSAQNSNSALQKFKSCM